MTDIPGYVASEFPEDARYIPGAEAFTARQQAEEEEAIAAAAGDEPIGGRTLDGPIFYKEDSEEEPEEDSGDLPDQT